MTNVVSISPIDWYTEMLRKSGVSETVADFAGITLETDGFKMPYHDIQGNPTGIASKRFNTDDKERRYKRVEGIGLPIAMYWPLHPVLPKPHQTLLGENIHHELWVTEGERKSLCLQSEMLGQGIPGSAVSMPGISVWRNLIQEIERSGVQFAMATGMGVVKRRVVLCYDWNKDNDLVRSSEANLYDYFNSRGADVVVLRWALTTDQLELEQKVDDWLVAGGSLTEALEYSPPYQGGNAIMHKYNELYGVYNGRVIMLEHFAQLTSAQFMVQTKNEYDRPPSGSKSKKPLYHAERWLEWPNRRTISELVFEPPAIGEEPTQNPPTYNISAKWPKMGKNTDFTAFDRHLRWQCETDEQCAWLRCHFAHSMLFPNEITSNAICFADDGDTGKGMLLVLLEKVYGSMFNLTNAEEITGRFNDNMAGRVLVWYDEPSIDRFKNLEAACKRLVGNPHLKVEGKGGKGTTVPNRIRLVVSCNLAYAARLDKSDRRWNYFGGSAKLPANMIDDFLAFTHDPRGHDWRSWALGVYGDGDWRGVKYSPNRLGPISARRTTAIAHAQSIYMDMLEDEQLEGKDIWPVSALNHIASQYGIKHNPTKLGMELTKVGALGHVIKMSGAQVRVRAVRNFTKWEQASHSDMVDEYLKDVTSGTKF
jgi:hypothetical protein